MTVIMIFFKPIKSILNNRWFHGQIDERKIIHKFLTKSDI